MYVDDELRGDKQVALAAVESRGLALEFCSDELQDDQDVALQAVEQNGLALTFCSDGLRNTEEIVYAALTSAGLALCDASEDFRNDVDAVRFAIEQDPLAFPYAGESIFKDEEIVTLAVGACGHMLSYASADLCNKLDVVMAAVRNSGMALQFVPAKMRADPDVVREAILQEGLALQYASENVQNDRETVMAACTQNGLALQFASDRLKNDELIVYTATDQNVMAMEFASVKWRNDKELAEKLCKVNGEAVKHVDGLRDDLEICTVAVRQNGLALGDTSYRVRKSKEVVLEAVRENGMALLFAAPELRDDRDIALAAVTKDGAALAYLPDELLANHDLVVAGLEQDGMAIVFVPEPLRDVLRIVLAAVTQNGLALKFASFRLRLGIESAMAAVRQNPDAASEVAHDLTNDPVFNKFALPDCPDVTFLAPKPRTLARRWALAMARTVLEPKFKTEGVSWDGVTQLLILIIGESAGSLVPVQAAYEDPDEFIKKLKKFDIWGEDVARKWAQISARRGLEPLLPEGVVWGDMMRVLQTITSSSKVRKAYEEPMAFIADLDKTYDLTGRIWAIAKLRPYIAPCLPEGLPYEDMYRVLQEIQTVRELRTYQDAPAYLVGKLRDNPKWGPSLKYVAAKVRPATEPKLPEGVIWEDFVQALFLLDPKGELEMYTKDWLKFKKKCDNESGWPPSRYWAIAHLRPRIEHLIVENGGSWEEAFPVLELLDVGMELWPAFKDPTAILKRLAE
jgi:hypothetical protein